MARAIVTVPATARRGEAIEIRTLIAHPMETGYRRDDGGALVPRDVLTRFTCHDEGTLVFAADLHPAIAANPAIAFSIVAVATGTLVFRWEGDNGFAQTESVRLTVT